MLTQAKTGQKEVLFNATHAKHTAPIVRPLEEQEERESQKLWYKTVVAIKESNHAAATEEKTKIEDRQRDETAKRQEQGIDWHPKLFRRVHGGYGGSEEGEEDLDWILNADMYALNPDLYYLATDKCSDGPTPEAKTKQILAVAPILKDQSASQDSNPVSPQHAQHTPQQPSQSRQQPTGQGQKDLIDFGQTDSSSSVPARGSSLQQQMTQQPTNAPAGLQEPLMPGHPIKRVDTLTKDLDEFVDAPGN